MSDPVIYIATWLRNLLTGWGVANIWLNLIMTIIGVLALAISVLLIDVLLVWVERKVVARFQDRLGPNRLGPFGLIQPIADVIKLLIKEDITPQNASRVIYNLAPMLAFAAVITLWAVIPLSSTVSGTDLNVGVLYIVAIGAIGTLSIIMAGWSSNNKFALVSAFRAVAQMVSYEVPMVISLLVPVLLARSMELGTIVEAQGIWFIVITPVAALIFLISSQAELGRAPFDIPEAESEIVAGFHIEYTGMKFALFYAGELLHALTISGIFATLFLGGWRGWGAVTYPVLGIFYFFIKAFFMYWVVMWLKYSFPRLRIDQMLNFNWKFLTPVALASFVLTALVDKAMMGSSTIAYNSVQLLVNLVLIILTLQIIRPFGRRERQTVAEPRPIARPKILVSDSSSTTKSTTSS
jgi:NADH-quinone oxidoreductase subunit H